MPERGRLSLVEARLDALDRRLASIERRVGTGPDTADVDEQIKLVRAELGLVCAGLTR